MVDWYKRTTREFDYLIVTYWLVAPGMRLSLERSEEFPPDHGVPDYTYFCTTCEQRFWFCSDVLAHVTDEYPQGRGSPVGDVEPWYRKLAAGIP